MCLRDSHSHQAAVTYSSPAERLETGSEMHSSSAQGEEDGIVDLGASARESRCSSHLAADADTDSVAVAGCQGSLLESLQVFVTVTG